MLALAPEFSGPISAIDGAGDAVPFEKVRVVLRRDDGSIVKDTMVDFPSTAEFISLTLTIPIPQDAPAEGLPMTVAMAYVNAAGDTVFRGGPNALVAKPLGTPGATEPITVPVTWDGPAKNASRVAITPKTGNAVAGRTQAFAGTAFDANDQPIANTPFVFSTLDPTRASVDPVTGVATWLPARGVARVIAQLPNGLRADTATFTVALPASKLVLASGGAQTGAVNTALGDTIVLRTLASDDVPVEGVIVTFAVTTGGGTLSASADTSDAEGKVKTVWTLGGTLGVQSITATSAGLTGSPFAVSATARSGAPARLEISQEPTAGTAGVAFAPALTVIARDAFGNTVPDFAGSVTLRVQGEQPPALLGTTTRTASAGSASFGDLVMNVAGSYRVIAESGTLAPDTTTAITVAPAAAARLSFVQEPTAAVAGAIIAPALTLRTLDAFGNLTPGFSGAVTLALREAGTATLLGTATQNAVAGIATFADLQVQKAGTGYRLEATSGTLQPDTSLAFTITAGAATQLTVVSGASQTGVAATALTTPLTVATLDAFGNPVSGVTVNWSVVSGAGTLGAASSVTDAAGQASTTWTLGSIAGAQSAKASAATLPDAVFSATVTAGAPTQLVLSAIPATDTAGSTLAPMTAQLRDALGNVVTGFAGDVSIALVTNPGAATLGGTLTRAAVAGVATFDDLSLTKAGNGYTLRASIATPAISSDTTAAFDIVSAAAWQFAIESGNNQTVIAGNAFTQPLRVRVLDAFGNPKVGHPTTWSTNGVVTLGSTGVVLTDAAGIAENTATAGTTAGAQSTGPSVITEGLGSILIFEHTVTAATPTQIVFITQPDTVTAGSPFPPTLFLEVRDANGNRVVTYSDSITISVDSGPVAGVVLGAKRQFVTNGGGTSLGQFSGLEIQRAGTYRLRATADGGVSGVSAPLVVMPNGFRAFALISGDRDTSAVGEPFGAPLRVRVTDSYGNPVQGAKTTWIDQGGGAKLAADTVLTDANGYAENTATHPATPVALSAITAFVLGGTDSRDFFYTTTAIPSRVTVKVEPPSTPTVGQAFSLTLEAQDAAGNRAVTYTDTATVELLTAPVGATLGGTVKRVMSAGAVTFTGLTLNKAGAYTLRINALGLAPDTTVTLTAQPAAAAIPNQITAPTSGSVGTALPTFAYGVYDGFDNLVTNYTGFAKVTLEKANVAQPDPVIISGDSVPVINGVATWSALIVGSVGEYKIVADFGPTLGDYVSGTITISAGAPAALAITTAGATSVTAGGSLGTMSVRVNDAAGNLSAFADTIRIVVDSGPSGGVITAGDTAVKATAGVATFNGITLTKAGTYRLSFRAAGLDSTAHPAVVVSAGIPAAMAKAPTSNDAQTAAINSLLLPFRVLLSDAFGNPTSGINVSWSVTAGAGAVSAASTATDAAGIAEVVFTAGTSIGGAEVTATRAGVTGSPQIFTATITAGAAVDLALDALPNPPTVNSVATPAFLLRARDAASNLITTLNDSAFVEVVSSPAGGELSGTDRRAFTGSVSFDDLAFSTPGSWTLRFISPAVADTALHTFTVSPGAADTVVAIAGDYQTGALMTSLANPFVVEVRDQYGNPVPNVSVEFMATTGSASVTVTPVLTDASGRAESNVVLGSSTDTVRVTATVSGVATPATFTVLPQAGAPANLYPLSQPTDVNAGATMSTFVFQVEDSYGNVVRAFNDTVSLEAGTPGFERLPSLIKAGATVIAVNGVATFSAVRIDSAGTWNFAITAKDGPTFTSDAFTVTAGDPSVLLKGGGDGQSGVVGTTLASPLRVRVTDAYGNGISGVTVNFNVITGSLPGLPASIATDANGVAETTPSYATTAGVVVVGAYAAGLTPDSLLFNLAATPDAVSGFELVSGGGQTVAAGDTTANAWVVRSKDGYGNTVAGVTVTFLSYDDVSFTETSVISDANGLASTKVIAGGSLGSKTVYAQASGASSLTTTVDVVAGAVAALNIITEPASDTAGATFATASAQLLDAFGNVVTTASNEVTLAIDASLTNGTIEGTTTATPVAGIVSFPGLRLTKAGSYKFILTATGLTSDTTASFDVSTAAATEMTIVSGNNQPTAVGAALAQPMRIRVRDAFGNPIAGIGVIWGVSVGVSAVDSTVSYTDADGYAEMGLTMATTLENPSVDAAYGDLRVTFTHTGTAGAATSMEITGMPGDRAAGSTLSPITITLRDGFLNLATAGADDSVSVGFASSPAESSLGGTLKLPIASGTATFSTLSLTRAGQYVLRFSAPGLPDVDTDPFFITAATPDTIVVVRGGGQAVTANGTSDSLVVLVADEFGNRVPDLALSWTSSVGTSLTFSTTTTDSEGRAWNFLGVGTAVGNVTATVSGDGLSSQTFTLTVSAGAASALRLVHIPSTATSGITADSIVVEAIDEFGNRDQSFTGSVTLAKNVEVSPNGAIAGTLTVAADSGVARFSDLVFSEAGNYGLLFSSDGLSGLSSSLTVQPGAEASVAIIEQPSSGTAGTPLDRFRLVVRDAAGNVITGSTTNITVAVDASLTAGTLGGTTTKQISEGNADFTDLQLTTAGTFRLVFSAAGLVPDTSGSFTVSAGSASALAASGGNLQSMTVGIAADSALAVRVTDEYGNPIGGWSVDWRVTSGSAVIDSAITTTDADGVARTTFSAGSQVGSIQIEANAGTAGTLTFTAEATVGAATQLAITAAIADTVAGATLAGVVVEARDGFENRATGFASTVTVAIDSGPAGATLGGTLTSAATAGAVTFGDLTLDKAGAYRLRVTADGVTAAVSDVFSIGAAAADSVVIVSGDAQTDTVGATADTLVIRVVDAFGNPISGAAIDWARSTETAGLFVLDASTDGEGLARAIVTLGGTPQVVTITATHAALTPATFTLTSTPATPTALFVVTSPSSIASPGNGETFEIEVRDAFGNRVAAFNDSVGVALADGPAGGVLGGLTKLLAVNGLATFDGLTFTTAGSYTLRFGVAGLDSADATVAVTAGVAASIEIVSGDGQSGFTGLGLDTALTVRVRDGANNPVAGDTVIFTLRPSADGGLFDGAAADTVITDAAGIASTLFTAGSTVGIQDVRATNINGDFVDFSFTVAAQLGNAVWTGNADTDWANSANWLAGYVPSATDSVHVLADRPNYPSLTGNVAMTRLYVDDGVSGFAVGDHDLEVAGDFRAPQGGAFTIGTLGQIRVTGTGARGIRGALPRLVIENGQYAVSEDAGSTWSVFGDLRVINNGRLVLDATDSVFVTGNFETLSGGQLAQAAGSDLFVFGDVTFGGGSTSGLLTGGQLTVAGDFSTAGSEPGAFTASAAHETRFIGSSQSVSFTSPDEQLGPACFASCFGRVVADSLMGSDTLQFLSSVKALGGFQVSNGALLAAGVRVTTSAASTLRADSTVIGTIAITGAYPDFGPNSTVDSVYIGGSGLMPNALTIPTVLVGTRELQGQHNASLSVSGQLLVGSGSAVINGTLRTIANSGSIRMLESGDTLTVLGDALFGGFGNQAHLTAGVLRVAGNFDAAASTFIASGTHRTELIGGSSTQVGMALSGFGTSSNHFQFLWLRKTDGAAVATTTPLAIQGQLITTEPDQAIFGAGLNNPVTIHGASISALRLNNQPLIIRGNGIVSQLDSLRFENFDANLRQLEIERETLGATLNAPVFDSLATDPTYLWLVDPTPADPSLTVEVNDPRPAFRGNRVNVGAGATLTGWSQFAVFDWNNASGDQNWFNADNWAQFVAPTATDSVVVPSGFFPPIISSPATVRALVSSNGLPIQLNAVLTVSGRLNLSAVEATTINCGAGGSIRLDGIAASVPVGGQVACNVAVGAQGAFTASDFRATNLRMEDGGDFTVGAYTLTVTGDLVASSGTLRMNDDFGIAVIEGDATFASAASGSPALTGGVLRIGGAFTQSGAADAFQPQGTHVVEIDGSATQAVTFTNPASTSAGSFFNRLVFNTDAATVELGSDVYVRGAVEKSFGDMLLSSPGAARTLYSVGANVSAATFDNVRWVVDSAGSVSALSGVTFQGLEGDGDQLRLRGTSGTLTIADIVFDTTGLVSGDVFLAAEDPDAAANGNLSVIVSNPRPVVHGGRILQDGGIISGWDEVLTFVWDGSASNDFTNPANWVLGVAPSPSDSVFIPSAANYTFFPAITNGSVNVRALVSVDDFNTITIDEVSLLQVTERAVFAGEGGGVSCAPGGQFLLTNVASISGRLSGCDLRINGGLVTVEDSVIVGDNLRLLNDAVFDINGAVVRVDGNFSSTGTSKLVMNAVEDSLLVTGTASFGGGDQTGLLTHGFLEVESGFSGSGTNEFVASDLHRTRLGGNGMLDFHSISDDNGDLRFARLELFPQAHKVSRTIATDYLTQPNGGSLELDTLSGNRLIVQYDYQGATNSSVDAPLLEIGGALLTNGAFGVDTVRLVGMTQQLRAFGDTGVRITYQRVEVAGNVRVEIPTGDSLVIGGSVGVLSDGSLTFDDDGLGTAVTRISGNLRTDGTGTITMQVNGSRVRVFGDATFAGGSTAGQLTAGTLELHGNFAQTAANSTASFQADIGHFTEFWRNADAVTVAFASPGYGSVDSRFGFFQHIPTASGATMTLGSDVYAGALLQSASTPMELRAPELQRYTVHAQGMQLGRMGFRRVDLSLTDGYFDISADTLHFSESDPAGTPLRIARTGGAFAIDTLVFGTLPTTGRYLRLEDTALDGDSLRLTVSTAVPGYFGAYVDLIDEAVLSGWEATGPAVWVGGVSTAFENPLNWLSLSVPTASDSVTIPAGFTGSIVVSDSTAIGALAHLSPSATLQLNNTLMVNGTFSTLGNPVSCSGGIILANAVPEAAAFSTTAAGCDLTILSGAYQLDARTVVKNVEVLSDATVELNGRAFEALNFYIQDSAAVVMQASGDTLRVSGDLSFSGRNSFGLLTAGSIEVFGDFSNGGAAGSFVSLGSQRVVLGDSTGVSEARSLTFTAGDSSYFHNLVIANGDYQLTGDIRVLGSLRLRSGARLDSGVVVADLGLFMEGTAGMTADRVAVRGNFFPNSAFSADTVDFNGPIGVSPYQVMPAVSAGYRVARVFGSTRIADFGPAIKIAQRLEIVGAPFALRAIEGAPNLSIQGDTADLVVRDGGSFGMLTSGTVTFDSLHFAGASTEGLMQQGTLRVRGALVQAANGSPSAFRPDSLLTVELLDSVVVSLANPDSSRFNNLKFGEGSTLKLLSDIAVDGTLSRETFGSVNNRVESDTYSSVPPRRITVTGGMDFSGGAVTTEFANVALRLVDDFSVDGGSYSFSRITFTEMDSTSTYLDLTGFQNYTTIAEYVTFATPVTTGKYFEIPAGTTVAFQNSFPAVGCIDAPDYCVGPRYEPGAPAEENVFTGSGNWSDANNWSLARVPRSTDDVLINDGSPFLDAGQTRYARNLTVAAGADLFADANAVLEIRGDFSNARNWFGDNGSTIRFRRSADAGPTLIDGNASSIDDFQVVFDIPLVPGADSIVLQSPLEVGGSSYLGALLVASGVLDLNGQWLEVDSLITAGTGSIRMDGATDSIRVNVQARFEGGSTAGRLTDGRLVVAGGFRQAITPDAFAASGNHTTYLVNSTPTVQFEHPGVDSSHFATLRRDVSGTATLASDIVVTGNLVHLNDANQIVRWLGGDSQNREIRVGGISNSTTDLRFDNTRLRVVEGGSFGLSNGIRFENMDEAVDQLTVERNGGSYTLNVQFSPIVSGDGHYVVARDNVLGNGQLTLIAGNVSPSGHDGRIITEGEAQITNWDEFSQYVFTGTGVDPTNVFAPDNWDNGVLPSAISTVRFGNAGVTDSVVINSNVQYRNVIFDPGAKVIVDAWVNTGAALAFGAAPRCETNGLFVMQPDASGAPIVSGSSPSCGVRVVDGNAQSAGPVTLQYLVAGNGGYFSIGSNVNDSESLTLDSLVVSSTGTLSSFGGGPGYDTLRVKGLARIESGGSTQLADGRIEFLGDVVLDGDFVSDGSSRVFIGDPLAPASRSISIGSSTARVDSLTVNPGTTTVTGALRVGAELAQAGTGSNVLTGDSILVGRPSELDGRIVTATDASITAANVVLHGTLAGAGTFQPDTVTFVGRLAESQRIPGRNASGTLIPYQFVRVASPILDVVMGEAELADSTSYQIAEHLEVLDGRLALVSDADSVTLQVSYIIVKATGRLEVANTSPLVRVRADTMYFGSEQTSTLDAGLFEVSQYLAATTGPFGNIYQFNANQNHTFRLVGSTVVTMAGTTGNTEFGTLEFEAGDIHEFRTDIWAKRFARRSGDAGPATIRSEFLGAGNGVTLYTSSLDLPSASGTLLSRNVRFILNSDFEANPVPTMQVNDLTFEDMDPASTFLLANFKGAVNPTFTNVSFNSPVSSGKYFELMNGLGGSTPQVTFVNAFPAVDCLVGSCNVGDSAPLGGNQVATWVGGESADWNNPANWSPAQVPTFASWVEIPDSATTANDPIAYNNPRISFLGINANGFLRVGVNDTLHVYGNINVEGSVGAELDEPTAVLAIHTTALEPRLLFGSGPIGAKLVITGGLGTDEGTARLRDNLTLPRTDVGTGLAVVRGELDVFGVSATVADGFRTEGTGKLRMNDPLGLLSIGGNVAFEGGSTLGLLTDGEIQISGGDFTQRSSNSQLSFAATENHTVRVTSGDYNVYFDFESPDSTLSRFANLALDRPVTDGSIEFYYSAVFATNITRLSGLIYHYGDGSLTLSGGISNVDPSHEIYMDEPGAIVRVLGVNQTNCGGLDLNVFGYLENFQPTVCHTLEYAFSAETGTANVTTNALWAASNTAVFAVGDSGTIQYQNGNAWFTETSNTIENLYAVHGTSDSDVWAVGANGTIMHFDGLTWSASSSGTSVTLRGVYAVSATDVVAVGDSGTVLQYDGSLWQPVASPGTSETLFAATGRFGDGVLAVGANGAAIRRRPTWGGESSSTSAQLNGAWNNPTGFSHYVVGAGGLVRRVYYAGLETGYFWWPETSPTSENLNAIAGSGENVVIVGDNGSIFRMFNVDNFAVFLTVSSPTNEQLRGVAVTPDGTVYAGGTSGVILKGVQVTPP